MIRFALSALGSLWLLSGLLSFHVIATTPRDPSKPSGEMDAANWVMFVWCSLCLVLIGPFGLSTAIALRDKRRKELREERRMTG